MQKNLIPAIKINITQFSKLNYKKKNNDKIRNFEAKQQITLTNSNILFIGKYIIMITIEPSQKTSFGVSKLFISDKS